MRPEPNIIGKTVRLEGADYRVVGIMPSKFHVPMMVSLVVAQWMTKTTAGRLPESMLGYLPNYGRVELNYVALAYALLIALATAVIFSIGPALRTAKVNLNEVLKETSRGEFGKAAQRGHLRRSHRLRFE